MLYFQINYSIIQPEMNSTELSIPTISKNYVIFSTVLNKDGRPGLWHGQTEVHAWSGEHRNYDVQMQFVNNTRTYKGRVSAVVTWNHTGGMYQHRDTEMAVNDMVINFGTLWIIQQI